MHEKKISSLMAWKKYVRGFICIGGWLQQASKLTNKEYASYFWEGINKKLQTKIESRLMASELDRDLMLAFPVDKVTTTTEKLLHRDRFDADLLVSDIDSDTDKEKLSEESLDEGSDSESCESEQEFFRKGSKTQGKHTKKKETKKVKSKVNKSPHQDQKGTNPKGSNSLEPLDEMEGLIKQMSSISLEDPDYALLYYRATRMDPSIKDLVAAPAKKRDNNNVYSQNWTTTRDNGSTDGKTNSTPGNYQNRATPGSRFYFTPDTPFQERKCYGCGEKGYSSTYSPQLTKLVGEGKLTRIGRGKVARPDGRPVRRMPEETVVEAINREDKMPTSHFIRIDDKDTQNTPSALSVKRKKSSIYIKEYNSELQMDTEESERDRNTYLQETSEDSDEEYRLYPVERTTWNSTQGRKEWYDKVFPPKQGQTLRKVDEQNNKGKDSALKRTPTGIPIQPKAKSTEPTPVPRYQKPQPNINERSKSVENGWDSEDIIMDDVEELKRNDKVRENTYKPISNPDWRSVTRQRTSDISAKVQPERILEMVLKTPIQLEVGELLGTSRELSGILANAIKPKSLGSDPKIEAHSIWTKMHGLLIKIAMHCDGQAINTIIDTGSQLNIVNKHIWKTIINRPIDIAKSVSMNDANGGEGKLHRLVQNVPLNCGGVSTQANLFVGDHVPFSYY
ncbi:hypothetical protein EDB19DRAFT_1834640 [Suillus lakei]|nr:hypothetical protein EDB19DRAFT_1834640 [Suillus lakei]